MKKLKRKSKTGKQKGSTIQPADILSIIGIAIEIKQILPDHFELDGEAFRGDGIELLKAHIKKDLRQSLISEERRI